MWLIALTKREVFLSYTGLCHKCSANYIWSIHHKKGTYLINFDEIISEIHKDIHPRIFFKWLKNSKALERIVR